MSDLDVINRIRAKGIELIGITQSIGISLNHYIFKDEKIVKLFISKESLTKDIFEDICSLKNLEVLSLIDNQIEIIFDCISSLDNLKFLNLKNNNIQVIPNAISSLNNLESLILSNNKIHKISKDMLLLDKLKFFSLSNNPIIKNVFKEVHSLEIKEFIAFFLSLQSGKIKQLNEAKILVLGDERVGKTSIVNRITNNEFEKNQKTTEGINIQNYKFSNNIKVNIWDFAGQEITHQTHQFFLSSRSLYLLVLDAQKEDNSSEIYDWLEIIKSNARNSLIIVVVNKIDKNEGYRFDINRYKNDFPNIVNVIYTSAQENIYISNLIKNIENLIEKLDDVKAFFNKDWFFVKEEMENLSKNIDYIEGGEFDKICEKYNILDEFSQEALLNLLNQLGTVIKYENRLNNIQVLNPLWVTNAVYKVIRSNLLQNAIVKREYLHEIFKNDSRYKQRHYQWIMDLLIQFEVAFRISEDEILIPSRLFNNQPDFNIKKFQRGLNLRYTYEGRLKKSVIAQFMVKMSRYLTNREVPYWKNGVFLERMRCKAVVISNIDKREITVNIESQDKNGREFLAIIREKFDEINMNKEVLEEIPLVVDKKIVGYEEYTYLLDLERDGEKTIILKTNTKDRRKRFEISELLDGYVIKKRNKIFDYEKLRDDLIEISLSETKSRNSIYKESEDETNDRFEKALFNRNYNVVDQSRGGESSSGINAGERDLVIRNSRGLDECVIEAFILKSLDSTVINKHYEKLVKRYDSMGNMGNFILVYSKTKNFNDLWEKYIEYDGFDNFVDTRNEYSQKFNVRVGISEYRKMKVYHLFINFYSYGED